MEHGIVSNRVDRFALIIAAGQQMGGDVLYDDVQRQANNVRIMDI